MSIREPEQKIKFVKYVSLSSSQVKEEHQVEERTPDSSDRHPYVAMVYEERPHDVHVFSLESMQYVSLILGTRNELK